MGRKIPAKKHRGVKDPLVQQARRLQSLQGRINSPPRDPDEQPVPRSLLRLFPATVPASGATPQRAQRAPRAPTRIVTPLSSLRRGTGEGAKAFSQRITEAVRALSTPATALRYPDESEQGDEDSRWERMAARRRQRRGAARGAGTGEAGEAATSKRRRLQRVRQRRSAARLQALAAAHEAPQYERLPFGEVAPRPPNLPKPVKVGGGGRIVQAGGSKEAGGREAGGREAGGREAARVAAVAAYRALKAERRAAAATTARLARNTH